MAYKDKDAQREAAKARQKALRDKRKGVTEIPSIVTPEDVTPPPNVTPSVTPAVFAGGVSAGMGETYAIEARVPTQADVASGKAWVVLSGPYRGELRWYGKLAQSWKNVPCQIVDGICVAEHYEGRHITPALPAPTSLPMVRFIKASPNNLSKLQRIAGSLGKLAGEVRFGLDGPTFEEIGETIGYQVGEYAKHYPK